MPCTPPARFSVVPGAGSRRAPDRQIEPEDSLPTDRLPVPGKAPHPFRGNGSGGHGRDTTWELKAREVPEHIKANWPGNAWIVEMDTTTTTRKGKHTRRTHRFLTSIRTTPDALLRLIRQRWSIEKKWHWARDAQLGEEAHSYANRTGAPVFSFLRTVVMNLLRRGGYRSIRQGLRELAYDIK